MTKQAAAFMFAIGEAPQLWVDGVKNVLAVPPGIPAGVTSVTDTLELGRGGRGGMLYWKGRCSFLGLSSRRQPEAVLQTVTAAFADPKRVYGHGTVNRVADAIKSPVALPVTGVSSAPGQSAAVNVGAASYDPGGLALTVTAATIATGNGGATFVGGTITVTPASDAAADDLVIVDYTIANSSGKSSSGRVYVTVSSGTWPISGGAQDAGDALGATPTTINVPADMSLTAALAAATFGTKILVAAGTYSGNYSFANAGTGNASTGIPTAPIYLMAADPSVDATASNGVYLSGTVNLNKDWVGIIGRGIRLKNVVVTGKGCRVSRCVFRDGGVRIDLNNSTYKWCRIDRNWVENITGSWIEGSIKTPANAYGTRIYKNYVNKHTSGSPGEHVIQILTKMWEDSHLTGDGNLFNSCLLGPHEQRELWSFKVGGIFFRNNSIDNTTCDANLREAVGGTLTGNWLGNNAHIQIRGDGHLVANNHGTDSSAQILITAGEAYAYEADGVTPNYGNTACASDANWGGKPNKWNLTVCLKPGATCVPAHTAASNCIVRNNSARITLGYGYGTGAKDDPIKSSNITLAGNKYAANRVANSWTGGTAAADEAVNGSLANQASRIPNPTRAASDQVGPWVP